MSKKIKFNLRCDGSSVRNLDDLRDNYSVEDILCYFESGMLSRWLRVRGFQTEYEQIEELKRSSLSDPVELTKKMAAIFDMESDLEEIEKSAYIFKYHQERDQFLKVCGDLRGQEHEVIEAYFNGYGKCIDAILENHIKLEQNIIIIEAEALIDTASDSASNNSDVANAFTKNQDVKENLAAIKASVTEIADHYARVLDYDFQRFLLLMIEKAPFAVYALLMNPKMRELYLNSSGNKFEECRKQIAELNLQVLRSVMKGDCEPWMKVIKAKRGNTSGTWDFIQYPSGDRDGRGKERGAKCLIIGITVARPSNSYRVDVCEFHEYGAPYSNEEIEDKYPILNGLEYRSNTNNGYVVYLEV